MPMKRVEILYYDDETNELVLEMEDFRIIRLAVEVLKVEEPRSPNKTVKPRQTSFDI